MTGSASCFLYFMKQPEAIRTRSNRRNFLSNIIAESVQFANTEAASTIDPFNRGAPFKTLSAERRFGRAAISGLSQGWRTAY